LTKFVGTPFASLIADIENVRSSTAIGLGLELLQQGEDSINNINRGIWKVKSLVASDGGLHDMSLQFAGESCGLTIHCSHLPADIAKQELRTHCEKRKYLGKADRWYGLALLPDGTATLVTELRGAWKFNANMEAKWGKPKPLSGFKRAPKVGRNDPCPCGSAKKYKKCHGA
jgi:hypothetical protein